MAMLERNEKMGILLIGFTKFPTPPAGEQAGPSPSTDH